jgi:hypothetical protein
MHFSDGMYAFAQNAVVEGIDGNGFPVLQNEPSNTLGVNFPSGSTVVGFTVVPEQSRIIWMLAFPETGMSEIGETLNPDICRQFAKNALGSCDDCSLNLLETTPLESGPQTPCANYTTIQPDACLNFTTAFPVTSSTYRLTDCTLQLVFTDANNARRYLEFNYVNDDPTQGLVIRNIFYQIIGFANPPCDNPIYGPNLDCNALNIQPNFETPCIQFDGLTGGGSNLAGVYQFFIAMSDINGVTLSSYLSATNPIPIFTKAVTVATNYPTDRSIKLTIENLDPTGAFQYYTLAVAKTIDGVTSFFLVGNFPVTQTLYTYTGNNPSEIPLTAEVIFALYPYYETAGTVGQSNGILFFGNVKEYPRPNLQRVANEIILQWQTIAIPEEVYYDPNNVVEFRSAMRDEVYPYGIQFIWAWGDESNAYHIPGRVAIASDLEIITNDDVVSPDNCSGTPLDQRWQVYNTATILGGDLSIYNGCIESCYQYGDFSYWESTETYPNLPLIWGELCGFPIRHHKFPDSLVTHIHNRQNGTVDASGATFHQNNIVYPIGVKVDHDSVRAAIANAVTLGLITATDAANIVGYRILRGNRVGNKSVIAKGLLYDVNQYQRVDMGNGNNSVVDLEPIFFANYPYNDLRSNPFLTNNFENYALNNIPEGPDLPFTFSNRYTFHSPDTHFNQPGLGTELKLETVEYGQSQGFYNKCQKQPKEKLLSEFSYGLAFTGGTALAIAKLAPPRTSSYTVKGTIETTGTIPEMQFADGTSSTTLPSTPADYDLMAKHLPLADNTILDRGFGTKTYDPLIADEYTIVNTPSAVFQNLSPTAADAIGQGSDNPDMAALGVFASALGIIGLLGGLVFILSQILSEMTVILDLIDALVPYKDWAIQYNSIGKYNEYTTVANDNGVKRRVISAWDYLDDTNQFVNEPVDPITGLFDAIKFNNLYREDSVYLKYAGDAFPDAGTSSGIVDTSRTRLSDFPFNCTLNVPKYEPISSYYASIKNYIPDQYGTIYNIQYLRTGSCAFDMNVPNSLCRGVYGGDTFISRFALKIKVPYFLSTAFELPDGTDFDYSQITNLAYPRYYFNNTPTVGSGIAGLSIATFTSIISSIASIYEALGGPSSIRDCASSNLFEQIGYIYLYHYGIPFFFAESDYDVDYRYAIDNLAGDFYPHQGDLDFWLQEINVPITEPNQYHYNNTYSKQNTETSIAIDAPNFMPGRACTVNFPNRIISSDNQNWFTFPANDFFDNPLTDGTIISIDGIENQTVLVRSLNKTSIFKSILRTVVDGQTVQIGNGGVFANPPQDFGTTTLGYIGTQNRGILHTEYGHIWADAKRGQVFNMATGASGVDEISKDGMKNWFKENLPFRLLRDFANMPETDIDNNFVGVGLIYSFDKRNNKFAMTKRDWSVTNPNVFYDSTLKQFYILSGNTHIPVALGDPKFFKDCSWTVSYNFFTKSWVSFHSYKPDYYIDFIDFFSSGINTPTGSSYWIHDLFNGSYQVFYGKLFPFIVEPVAKFEEQLKMLGSQEFDTEVRRYSNEFDYTLKKDIPGFNKAIVYNDFYNSGLNHLVKVDKNDFSKSGSYPIKGFNHWDIEVAAANYKWRFNQFYALNKDNTEIPFWLYAGNNEEKTLNHLAFNYLKNDYDLSRLRGQWFKTRLINDSLSNYKIIFKFNKNDQTLQFR